MNGCENILPDLAKNPPPHVTVALPIFNAGKHLRLAVLSIVNQTFADWELLLIDDGSTDDALQSIENIRDHRIRVFRDGMNKGLPARLNEAIDLARGQYLARMDQDDVSYPQRLARQVEMLRKDPQLDLVATRAVTIDESNGVSGVFPHALTHHEICAVPWRGFYFPHPTWMGKTSWFRKHRYTVPWPFFCEDQELLLRSYPTSLFCTVNEILFAYRIRSTVKFSKLAKTRLTFLSFQCRHFGRRYQWHMALMAVAVFFGRFLFDAFKVIRKAFFADSQKTKFAPYEQQWIDILKHLSNESRHIP